MTSKKSFLIHIDSLDVLDHLTDEQAGQLLKAFRSYHAGEDLQLPPLLNIAFTPFKNQFIRDIETYENVCNRNKTNGLKGGRPRNPKKPVGSLKTQRNPKKPKKADNDSDSDSDSKKDNDSDSANDNESYKNVKDLNIVAFEKYLAYRKESGIKKLTKHGEILAAKKLVKFGNQSEVVDQSIANGWSGLFELKNKVKQKSDGYADKIRERITNKTKPVIDGECHVVE